jgi:hypothetical protein
MKACLASASTLAKGKQTFARFLEFSAGTTEWIAANLPNRGRSAFLDELVLRIDGGCLANRWAKDAADHLREQCELAPMTAFSRRPKVVVLIPAT